MLGSSRPYPFFLSSTLRKNDMKNARTPNDAKMHIGTIYPPVAFRTTPIRSGTRHRPIFWIQKMS